MGKKILIFSLGPIFREHVHGGSQKVLREVAMYLGERGNKVDICCVYRDDNKKIFKLNENVTVYPVLRFKQTFPSSYKTGPFNLWKIIDILNSQIKEHDVFYIHDSCLNFPFLCNQNVPTIISLRDFLYPETLLGAFNFRRDKIIVNSKLTKDCVKYTVGNFLSGVEDRVELINNGINLELFKRKEPRKILELIDGKIGKEDLVILYPHRPEITKGIFQALELVRRLKKNGLKNLKILIPHYIDEEVSSDLDNHYNKIKEVAIEKGIEDNVIFHKWVPYELMPEYYSLGHLTLSIGNFIEAFGSNAGLESLSCSTPVIMSLVGAQKNTLPDNIVPKVAYEDLDSAEKTAMKILKGEFLIDFEEVRNYIKTNFSYEKMLRSYEEVICNTKISEPLKIEFHDKDIMEQKIIISPWCWLTNIGLYNDYSYDYENISDELKKFLDDNSSFVLSEIKIPELKQEITALMNKGVFVPEK